MITVGTYEAKTHLPRLLEQVSGGESVTITRHGRPIARLVPASEGDTDLVKGRVVAAELRKLRARVKRGKPTIRELIEAGRKR